MKKITTRLAISVAFLTALFTMACDTGTYPQYSGLYKLVSVSYSDAEDPSQSEIAGLAPPSLLRVTHRMIWDNNYWRHHVLYEAASNKPGEASGSFAAQLSYLTRVGSGCGSGPCDFGGTAYRTRKQTFGGMYDQNGAFCTFYGYDYPVQMISVSPEPALLAKIYWSHDEAPEGYKPPGVAGADSEQGVLQLTDPENAKVDDKYVAKWAEAVAKEGMKFTLVVSKRANTSYSGCDEGFPVHDNETDTGDITLRYELVPGSEDYSTDLRSEGIDGVEEDSKPNLFEQLSNFK